MRSFALAVHDDDVGRCVFCLYVLEGEVVQRQFLHAVEHGDAKLQADALYCVFHLYDYCCLSLETALLTDLHIDVRTQVLHGETKAEADAQFTEDVVPLSREICSLPRLMGIT